MSWRPPRDRDEFVPADCEHLHELANAYHPFIRFADEERFFPALAEAWLRHASSAPWPPAKRQPDEPGPAETGYDEHRRGTGVCVADADVTSVKVLGGLPNVDDRPLSLSDGPGDPHAIASYAGVDGSHFLDVGGWTGNLVEQFQGRSGDLDYLYRAFSELSAAINPRMTWEPVELMAHLPQFWVPQPSTPTVYCEARWAGDFPRSTGKLPEPDFPPMSDGSPLDRYLVLTYHYLYPAREPTDGEPEVRTKEGQWEAVSLFFDTNGELGDLHFHEPPEWVVISQGSDGPSTVPNSTDIRRWNEVAHESAHPVLFVARGSHRFFFEPIDGQTWVPGTGGPGVPGGGSYDNNSEFPGWESVLVGGLILAAALLALGLWVAALVVAIIAILFWLFSLIMDLCNDDSENPANPNPSNPEAGGDGPQGGDPAEPPADGSGGGDGAPGGDGDGTHGHPNTGSPSGQNTVSFDVRFIDRASRDGRNERERQLTGYPSTEPCEQPTWWDYSGRWGVRVAPGLSSDWASGDQRVDEFGRSWGYWHALRVFEQLQL